MHSCLKFIKMKPVAAVSQRGFSEGKSSFFFNMRKEEKMLYQILKVKLHSSQKDIKLAYYKLAKQYHPDFQSEASEKSKKNSEEMFKRILKAYEVLSNSMSRQAYDIEHRINSDSPIEQATYADPISDKNYYQPRTQTDFYHTKWTD